MPNLNTMETSDLYVTALNSPEIKSYPGVHTSVPNLALTSSQNPSVPVVVPKAPATTPQSFQTTGTQEGDIAAGYINSGVYNPNAPKPVVKTDTGSTDPTPASTYNFSGGVYESPELKAARDAQTAAAKADSEQAVDEGSIRASTLANFQAEIDATNAVYAEKLRAAQLEGQDRIGSGTAIAARRGLIGSDFGNAQSDKIVNANTGVYNSIQDEKRAALNLIYSKSKTAADDSIKAKTEAKKAGLNDYISYLAGADTRKATNATTAANLLLQQKHEPKDLTPEDLKKVTDGYGITKEQLQSAYDSAKPAYEAKKIADAKASEVSLKAGESVYRRNADGTYTQVASTPTEDKYTEAKDALGNPLSFNSRDGKYYTPEGKVYKADYTPDQTGTLDAPSVGSFLNDKTPEQQSAFKKLSAVDQSNVIQLLNGDVLLSDLMASRGVQGSAARQQILASARAIDPTFSENENKQRYAFKTEWNKPNGKAYITRNAINTGMGHLATLKSLSDQLGNTDFQKANTIGQWIAKNTNGPNAEIVGQFNDTINLLATEIAKAYAGGVPDVKSIQEQRDSINSTKPSNIINAIIGNKVNLMSSLLNSTAQEYKQTMGKFPEEAIVHKDVLDELKAAGVDTSKITTALIKQGVHADTVHDYIAAYPDKAATAEKILRDNPSLTDDDVLQILQPDFSDVGADTNQGSIPTGTGMRTDRSNNPTAMTTDVARTLGLVEGKDYVKGDAFDNGRYATAKLIGNPVAITIKGLDNGGFYTASGKPRWTHTAIPQSQWNSMSYEEKAGVVKQMYQKEGNQGALNKYFS